MLCWSTYVSCIELSGDHICHKQEKYEKIFFLYINQFFYKSSLKSYTETINATKAEPVQVRKNFWCIEKIRCSEMQPDTQEVVHVEVKALSLNHFHFFLTPSLFCTFISARTNTIKYESIDDVNNYLWS